MLRRRELLLGAPLIAGAAAAFALTPRERLTLLGDQKLEKAVPLTIGAWTVTPSNVVVLPDSAKGSLSARLYDQTVSRLYTSDSELPVMMVIAYGSTQSDQLQLHRPEVCYSAFGFEITRAEPVSVPLGGTVRLPARELVARSNDRVEPILYWTRVGDYLPTSGNEQRLMKLRSEMRGYVADGVLVRLSSIGEPSPEVFGTLQRFAREMLAAAYPAALPGLVGRPLAAELKALG